MSAAISVLESDVCKGVRAFLLRILGGSQFTANVADDSVTYSGLVGELAVNQKVRGDGIPSDAVISSIGTASTFKLSESVGTISNVVMTSGVEVVQQLDNRVAMPLPGFAMISGTRKAKLSTGAVSEDDTAGEEDHEASIDLVLQIDFFGPQADDWAVVFAQTFASVWSCDFLKDYGIQPLYCDEPRQVPMVTGEAQYEHRWLTMAHVQYKPVVSLPQEHFDAVDESGLSIISVDATYKEGA